jgi:hypothetical protein
VPGKETRYTMSRKLSGTKNLSGRFVADKISVSCMDRLTGRLRSYCAVHCIPAPLVDSASSCILQVFRTVVAMFRGGAVQLSCNEDSIVWIIELSRQYVVL